MPSCTVCVTPLMLIFKFFKGEWSQHHNSTNANFKSSCSIKGKILLLKAIYQYIIFSYIVKGLIKRTVDFTCINPKGKMFAT